MNTHSYKILEFDKLKEKILENIVIDENRDKVIKLAPYKDLSTLNNELKSVKDFMYREIASYNEKTLIDDVDVLINYHSSFEDPEYIPDDVGYRSKVLSFEII